MIAVHTILVLLAFVCFVLATIGVAARVNLVALGLALLTLTQLAPLTVR
jgi:hypothetical protein